MKLILISMLSLFIFSCAHHHEKPEHHHHHQYEKQCAYSVAHGELDVAGKDEFKSTHGGKTYYFSSRDKLDLFEKDAEKNISSADRRWSRKR